MGHAFCLDILSLFRMEVWFGQVDPEHAADKCGTLPYYSLFSEWNIGLAKLIRNMQRTNLDLCFIFLLCFQNGSLVWPS